MTAVCPSCKSSMILEPTDLAHGLKIRCSSCSSVFRIVKKEEPPRCDSQQGKGAANLLTLVVANEQKAFCTEVAALLADIADVHFAHDGDSALEAIRSLRPDAALIDVALPGMYGFQVCEKVRESRLLESVKLILLASVHDRRKYIHPPTSLYGADALIEGNRIEGLRELIMRLVPSARAGWPAAGISVAD